MSEAATAGFRAGASPEAIIAHYDAGNEFFRLWIGPDMIYSCALFEDGDDLASAQIRKLDHHIEAAGAPGKSRVLEVGCGWGALLRRLVTRHGVKHAVGLTLSPSQAEWVRGIAVPGMEVREEDWHDHKPDQPYDSVISVAAFEAFAHYGISPSEKMRAYQDFFSFCHRMLVDGGRLSIQTIAYPRVLDYVPPFVEQFATQKIFRRANCRCCGSRWSRRRGISTWRRCATTPNTITVRSGCGIGIWPNTSKKRSPWSAKKPQRCFGSTCASRRRASSSASSVSCA